MARRGFSWVSFQSYDGISTAHQEAEPQRLGWPCKNNLFCQELSDKVAAVDVVAPLIAGNIKPL